MKLANIHSVVRKCLNGAMKARIINRQILFNREKRENPARRRTSVRLRALFFPDFLDGLDITRRTPSFKRWCKHRQRCLDRIRRDNFVGRNIGNGPSSAQKLSSPKTFPITRSSSVIPRESSNSVLMKKPSSVQSNRLVELVSRKSQKERGRFYVK